MTSSPAAGRNKHHLHVKKMASKATADDEELTY